MSRDELDELVDRIAGATPSRGPREERERRGFDVVDVWDEGLYVGMLLDVDDEAWRDSYRRPGQYVTMKVGDADHRYIAIANSPDDARARGWEFLIDRTESLGPELEKLSAGDEVMVSQAEGPGYPTKMSKYDHVLMFVTGFVLVLS